jgi:hypothetical protein
MDSLFSIANAAVLPGWLLLLVAPGWSRTQPIAAFIVPGLLALAYLSLMVAALGTPAPEGGSFFSLDGVRALFTSDRALLAAWIHYLAFDLFVGAYEVRDARRRGLRHLFVIPCLVLTFLTGPVGFLLYLGVRALAGRRAA